MKSATSPPQPPPLLLALDATASVGIAWRFWGEPESATRHRTVPLTELDAALWTIAQHGSGGRVITIVERSRAKMPWFRASKATARQASDLVRRVWPKRHEVHEVDPRTWQAAVISGVFGDTKTASLYVARHALPGHTIPDDHQADAINMLHYLATTILLGREP